MSKTAGGLSSLRARVARVATSRRAGRIVAWTLAVVLLLMALAAWGVPRLVRGALQEQVAGMIGRDIAVGDITFNPFTLTLKVRELSVAQADAPPLLTFVELEASAAWGSVFRFAPVVDRLALRQPRIVAERLDAAHFSFSDIVERLAAQDPAAAPEPDQPLPRFSLNNIEIVDGSIALQDRVTGRRHVIDALTIGVPFISTLAYATDIDVLPRLHARINGSVLDMEGTTRPFEAERPSALHLRFEGLALQELADAWPSPLPLRVERALLDSDLQITFAQPPGATPTLRIAGRAGLRELDLRDGARQPLLAWQALGIEQIDLQPLARQVSIGAVTLAEPVAQVRRDAAGQLNWVSALTPAASPSRAQPEPAPDRPAAAADSAPPDAAKAPPPDVVQPQPQPQPPAAPAAPGAWRVELGSLALDAGQVQLRDEASGFDYALQGLDVRLDGLALPQPADRQAALKVAIDNPDGFALAADGPFAVQPLAADLAVQARELPLAPFQALLAQAGLGWRIDGGKAGAQAQVQVRAGEGGAAVALSGVRLDVRQLAAQDTSVKPAVKLAADTLALGVERYAPGQAEPIAFTVQAGGVQGAGRLSVKGTVAPQPLAVKAEVDLAALELSGFAPYIASSLNATVRSIAVGAQGTASFEAASGKTPQRAAWQGGLEVTGLRLDDRVTRSEFVRWKRLALARSAFALRDGRIVADLGDVSLDDFYGRVILSPEGKLNLSDIVANPGEARGSITEGTQAERTAPSPAQAAGLERDISLRSVTLKSGKVNFTDRYVKPNYTADLTRLQGTVSAVSSTRPQPAKVNVTGRVYDTAPFSLAGAVQPFGEFLSLDLQASAKGVDLPTFTTYSAKYVGYPIERGKLSVDVAYKIEDRTLTARNKVVLNQLTFGPRTDSPDALQLPVLLAVSLLKDRHGNIDLNLPVSGSLDDPQFSVGGIVLQVFVNLITKAITAPFSLLASAFGGGDELSFIAFEPGSAVLSDEALANLATLSTALNDRPALKLDVSGRADPAVDADGLRQAWLAKQLREAKARAQSTRARKIDPDTVELAPGDEDKYLEDAYGEADIDKPRNMIGLAKSLPAEEMKALLLAAAPADADALRQLAEARAQAVLDRLLQDGPADRIFLVSPRLDAQGVDDGGATSRVDFALK